MTIDIDAHRQLFIDDHLIDRCEGIARHVCPATKHPDNPVIRRVDENDPPRLLPWGSVVREDDGRYRAWWFVSLEPVMENRSVGYNACAVVHLESNDGLQWSRPSKPQVLCKHCDDPNRWANMFECFGVALDRDEPDPDRRYKLGFLVRKTDYAGPNPARFHPGEHRGLGVAFSGDGMTWRQHTTDDATTLATQDGATFWFHDPSTHQWVLTGRTKHIDPKVREKFADDPVFEHHWGRAVALAVSDDFVEWEPNDGQLALAIDEHDGPGHEIYGMQVFAYEGMYIGQIMMYRNYPDKNDLHIQLATSRDGVTWQRLSDRTPFIDVGPRGTWDHCIVNPTNNPPYRVGDELRFYYSGTNARHRGVYFDNFKDDHNPHSPGGAGIATIKLDRFAAMRGSGTLITKSLRGRGHLFINADTRRGRIKVSRGDQSVTVEDVDHVDMPLGMVMDDEALPLRFELRDADLFGFRVSDQTA